jgi:hypothetical protein
VALQEISRKKILLQSQSISLEDIDHSRTKIKSSQTNDICEHFP